MMGGKVLPPMEDNRDRNDASYEQKEPQPRMDAGTLRSRGKGVVSVLSLGASALAVICFVTGHTTLASFLSPDPVAAPAQTQHQTQAERQNQAEQLFSQAAFFVHYGHLPGRGTDDYDADDTEDDRQKLIAGLESYIASAPSGPPGKAEAAGQKSLARAQSLRHALAEMKPGSPLKLPKLPQLP